MSPHESIHLAVVTETYPPEVNGVAKTIHRMVEGLVNRGYAVSLFRPRQRKNDLDRIQPGIQEFTLPGLIIPIYRDLRFGFPVVKTLTRLFKKTNPDIVQVVTEGPLGLAAIHAAKNQRIPVVSEFHTNFHAYSRFYRLGFFYKVTGAYLRYFHNLTACTMVPAKAMRDQLTLNGYENISVVGRGVDNQLFHPSKRDRSLRRKWGVDDSGSVVIWVSRIAKEKNIFLVVEAYRAMQKINPDLKMVLVGDGPARRKLQEQNPDFIFCGMQVGENLARHYASGDIFLFPSQTETFGNVITEAMASRLAIVAFREAAAGEYLEHNQSAYLAESGDTQDFIRHAITLAGHADLVERMRQNSFELSRLCTWNQVLDDLEGVFMTHLK